MVGERSLGREAGPRGLALEALTGGAQGSEDAGMSSDNGGEDPPHRKPKGSGARVIHSGLVGP